MLRNSGMSPMPFGNSRQTSSVMPGRMVGLTMPTIPRQLENAMRSPHHELAERAAFGWRFLSWRARHNAPFHWWQAYAKRSMWDCNHTALHIAIESSAIEIGRLLLDAGADPNIRDDKYHATALV